MLNAKGEVVSRNAAEGAYGEDPYTLAGSAADRIAIKATKDGDGNLSSVEVTIRTTERIAEATLAGGVRLAVLDATGAVVRSTDAVPTLIDNWTASWNLTPDEWTTLVADDPNSPPTARPSSLSIAITDSLRAEGWSTELPILPAPDWATSSQPVFTSAGLPVEARESLETLASWLDGIDAGTTDTRTIYHVDSLGALGTMGGVTPPEDPAKLLLAAPFHAHPFLEPLTGQDYVRARWYDPAVGAWLSPDPLGYRDSSSLYAFAGGEPVNGRDALGLGDGYFGGLLNDDFSINPGVLDAKLRESGIWLDEQIKRISNPAARAAAQELKKLPDTVTAAAVTRANPTVGAIGGIAWFTNCHQQSVLNRTEQSELLGQDRGAATVSLIALNDCVGYNKFLRASFGWDPIAGEISTEQQEREAGEFTAQAFLAGIFARLANEPQQELVVTWPKSRKGRLGSPETREQIAQISDELEARGWTVTHGGGRAPEEYLPGPEGARRGSSWPDITATKNGRTLRINTVDTRADGITPTTREATNAARIRQQRPADHLVLIPKPKKP